MDLGKLKESLTLYVQVMEKLPFQSKLHGLAALQWSICQDSLSRSNEARVMYEKLQSHPSPDVSKKARQLVFSFQVICLAQLISYPRDEACMHLVKQILKCRGYKFEVKCNAVGLYFPYEFMKIVFVLLLFNNF